MNAHVLDFRPLQLGDESSFLDAVTEFRREQPPWNFALGWDDGEPFEHYVRKLDDWSRGESLPPRFVPNAFYVGVVNGTVVGRVSIRFQMNEFLSRLGGHIGYGVRPSARRRGYATQMLRLALPICHQHGIERALVTCDIDNVGSKRVIERCGGVLESITNDPELAVQKARYRIDTA